MNAFSSVQGLTIWGRTQAHLTARHAHPTATSASMALTASRAQVIISSFTPHPLSNPASNHAQLEITLLY